MLDGHIKSHPAEDLDTPQRFSYLPKFLTEEEINRLLATPDISTAEGIRDRAVLEIMYATGLRVSELVDLKQTDVDLLAWTRGVSWQGKQRAPRAAQRVLFIGCSSIRRSRQDTGNNRRQMFFCTVGGRSRDTSHGL